MKWLALIIFVLLQSRNCNKEGTVRVPPCIGEKIDAIQQLPKYNPPATVYRYSYQNQYVYLISSNCCDQYNYLYDKNCNVICAPTGGLTGRGDGRCADFKQNATGEVLVWKDPR